MWQSDDHSKIDDQENIINSNLIQTKTIDS